jgi:hypothetical protein
VTKKYSGVVQSGWQVEDDVGVDFWSINVSCSI